MKKHVGMFSLLLATTCGVAHAQPAAWTQPAVPGLGMSFYGEYSSQDAKLDSGDTIKLKGGSLGLSVNPATSGAYGRFNLLGNNKFDLDFYELEGGGQLNLLNVQGFYVLATAGIGVAGADSSYLDNSVTFLSLPVGLEAGFSPIAEFSLYAGVGYKWLFDVTGKTTCNDGTTTNSTGHGACSYHDGIDYYNDTVGDADGVTFRAGLRVNF